MKNVHLRSALRQPLRTALLILLLAAVGFVFFSQVLQHRASAETVEQYSATFHAYGGLKAPESWISVLPADEVIRQSTYVKYTDPRYMYAGFMKDTYNVDILGDDPSTGISSNSCIFVQGVFNNTASDGVLTFSDVSLLCGMPEMLEGDRLSVQFSDAQRGDSAESLTAGQTYFFACNVSTDFVNYPYGYIYTLKRLGDSDTYFFPLEYGAQLDLDDPRLSGVADDMQVTELNTHAVRTYCTKDMDAICDINKYVRPNKGRILTYEDYESRSPVCVISWDMATRRGISVGDMLTVTLSTFDDDYANLPYINLPSERETDWRSADTLTLDLEVVGLVQVNRSSIKPSYEHSMIFIPTSLVPDTWHEAKDYAQDEWYSFELNSPGDREAFLQENSRTLREMGYTLTVEENVYWDAFQDTAGALVDSTLTGAQLFGAALAAAGGIVILLYVIFRRRDMAIQRALGVPRRRVTWQAWYTLALLGVAALAAGGAGAYQYGMKQVRDLLWKLRTGGAVTVTFSEGHMAVLVVLAWTVLCCAGLTAIWMVVRRPALVQLQGGNTAAAQRRASIVIPVERAPSAGRSIEWIPVASTVPLAHPAKGRFSPRALLRFWWRQLLRSPGRSLLAVVLAGVFTLAIGYLNWNITDTENQMDQLLHTIEVDGELLNSGGYVLYGARFSGKTVQLLEESGYLQDMLLEGSGQAHVQAKEGASAVTFRATANPEQLKGVEDGTLEFVDVLSSTPVSSLGGRSSCALLEEGLAGALGAAPLDQITVTLPDGTAQKYTVIGLFRNQSTVDDYGLLIGLEDLRDQAGRGTYIPGYARVEFTVDPQWNGELDTFKDAAAKAIRSREAEYPAAELYLNDSTLTLAVQPLGETAKLLAILFPAAIVVSLLAAAGLALLMVIQTARTTAMLRVLGVPRRYTVVLAVLDQIALTVLGAGLGTAAALGVAGEGFRWQLSLALAGLYVLAAMAGAGVAAAVMTARNPLALLQVKE